MRNKIIVQKMDGYAAKVIEYCEGYSYEQFTAETTVEVYTVIALL